MELLRIVFVVYISIAAYEFTKTSIFFIKLKMESFKEISHNFIQSMLWPGELISFALLKVDEDNIKMKVIEREDKK